MTKAAFETLDRSREFSQVFGETPHNIAFYQKGFPYDAHGKLIVDALTADQVKVLEARRAKAAKAAEAAPPDDEPEAPAAEVVDDEEEDTADDDGVNLVAWLKGEVRYRPHELQNAVKARYGVNKPRPRDIAIYLVEEQKLVPPAEVSTNVLPR